MPDQAQRLFGVLSKPFADEVKATKKIQGNEHTFVEWYHYIARGWREFPEGFSSEIRSVTEIGKVWGEDEGDMVSKVRDDRQLLMVVRVTDMQTGIYHEATGTAPIRKEKAMFGGAAAEAESQALRRAFAKFGMGLEMYMDEEDKEQAGIIKPATPEQVARMKQLVKACGKHKDLKAIIESLRGNVNEALDKEFATDLAITSLEGEMANYELEVPDPT